MSVDVNKINSLNAKIKEYSEEKQRQEGQRQAWLKNLEQECANFEKDYGVKLVGKDFTETVSKVKKLFTEESAKLTKEMELAEKVITYLDNDEYDEANKLLGVKVSSSSTKKEVVEEVEIEEEVVEEVVEEFTEDVVEEKSEVSLDEIAKVTPEEVEAEKESVAKEVASALEDKEGTIMDDIDVGDLDFSSDDEETTSKETKSNGGTQVQKAKESLSSVDEVFGSDFSDFEIEDDFGLGDLVGSTKNFDK